jgi:hypothetical protein
MGKTDQVTPDADAAWSQHRLARRRIAHLEGRAGVEGDDPEGIADHRDAKVSRRDRRVLEAHVVA